VIVRESRMEILDKIFFTHGSAEIRKPSRPIVDAIIATLVEEGRIELRNFGVFEVKRRAPRKARNPRTGAKVFVPAKNVVTFKPGKEMEELVRKMNPENLPLLDDDADADQSNNGPIGATHETPTAATPTGSESVE